MDEMKRCPFCGGEATLHSHTLRRQRFGCVVMAKCKVCGSTGKTFYSDMDFDDEGVFDSSAAEDAVEAWNRRV